jgi:hypothetical protein
VSLRAERYSAQLTLQSQSKSQPGSQ